ncbi:MAG TPA: MASE1 domain-containing protein [Polyangia bacterium]|jgi:signal transduction histidine kinase|nr:MASE1 domain-containing protein [Polyangia bacterium]
MSVAGRRVVVRAVELALLFVVYAATAKLGLSFDAIGGIATTVWPPTGIALAALCLRGVGLWPAIAAAAFAVNATAGIPLWSAAIIAVGNTLEAVIGAALLRRAGFDRRLERLGDVFLLVGIAALASTTVSATFGLLAALLGHVRTADGPVAFWAVWWVGDSLGDLLVAPLLFAWAASGTRFSRRPLRWLEAALLTLLVASVSATVFRHTFAWRAIHGVVRGTYPTVPLLIWAALRFEQRGVTSALLLVSAIAVSGAASGSGIFGAESPHERLLLVQCYMAVTAVSMLTLAAALAERRAAIRARDEFISIASHELKTPLTALKLRLGSALRLGERRAAAGDEQAEKMTRALTASSLTADRLGGLVDDLLDVSRLTAGRFALRLERVELGDLLREVVARLRDQAEEVGSTLELTAAAPIIGTWDRGRLEQVVTNLLSNAIKYGMGKPILVSADVSVNRLRLRVRDRGMGIPRADHSRIFQAFERLPTAERVGGLGLGLYIGRQIALAHGGTLVVESDPERGATFTLDLPLETPAP